MEYQIIKGIHMLCAVLSISGFIARGVLAIRQSPIMQQRWIKTVPHINDTLLLVSAITLAVMADLSPLQHPWLGMKIILLFFYIGLGILAMRSTGNKQVFAFLTSIALFAIIVGIAVTKKALILV